MKLCRTETTHRHSRPTPCHPCQKNVRPQPGSNTTHTHPHTHTHTHTPTHTHTHTHKHKSGLRGASEKREDDEEQKEEAKRKDEKKQQRADGRSKEKGKQQPKAALRYSSLSLQLYLLLAVNSGNRGIFCISIPNPFRDKSIPQQADFFLRVWF